MNEQAVMTVCREGTDLRRTFSSFLGGDYSLHAFVIGQALPRDRITGIRYTLIESDPGWRHPLREIYFRRMEFLQFLPMGIRFALVVDSFDVLCMHQPTDFERLLAGAKVGGCVEYQGSRYLGKSATQNFINGGVLIWNIPESEDLRESVLKRGRNHFRTIADDQLCLNETLYSQPDDLRILDCRYNFRAYLNKRQRGWPTVNNLDGVMLYHNNACIEAAKMIPHRASAQIEELSVDPPRMSAFHLAVRRFKNRLCESSFLWRAFYAVAIARFNDRELGK